MCFWNNVIVTSENLDLQNQLIVFRFPAGTKEVRHGTASSPPSLHHMKSVGQSVWGSTSVWTNRCWGKTNSDPYEFEYFILCIGLWLRCCCAWMQHLWPWRWSSRGGCVCQLVDHGPCWSARPGVLHAREQELETGLQEFWFQCIALYRHAGFTIT